MFSLPPQIVMNGVIAGSLYALIALGLALTYGVLKFVNLAHAEMATLGAYIFFAMTIVLDWPIVNSAILTALLVGGIGILIQKFTFKPIKKAASYTPMLAAIGVGIFLQAMVMIFAGPGVKTYDRSGVETYQFFGDKLYITNLQIIIIATSITFMLALFAFLKYTKTGKAIRAVSDNQEAAEIVGINSEKITTIIFFIASMLAGAAGILIGYENNLQPVMAAPLIIKSFTAIIVGGIGSVPAAVAGGFLIGIIENVGIGLSINGVSIPSSYKDVFAFALLILVLLMKPTGLFIRNEEKTRN
ncbi:MAG: branched-chain amino acid ABC transporter permease [Patescibacteria group bacterium]